MKRILFLIVALLSLTCCVGEPGPGDSPLPTPPVSPLATPTLAPEIHQEDTMNLGNIGTVEIGFLVVGLTQLICYFINKKEQPEIIDGKGKVGVALAIGMPLIAMRELIAGGYLPQETTNAIVVTIRVLGDSLAIPGIVGFVKQNFSR